MIASDHASRWSSSSSRSSPSASTIGRYTSSERTSMSSRKAGPASLSCSSSATRPRRWSPLEPGVELGGLPRTRSGVGAGWEAPPLFSQQKHLHRVRAATAQVMT
jgi:hypothetical protein